MREAFLNRPGRVDQAAGFLGLEVFTDTEDAAQFYLVTRWTDAECYGRWHASPEHHKAHAGIPKGLKLDASFTLVRTLDRIADPDTLAHADGVRDLAPAVAEFLGRSSAVHWLMARPDGAIVAWNDAMAEAIGGPADSLRGQRVWELLTESDAASLQGTVAGGGNGRAFPCRLNFVRCDGMPFTLECTIDVQPDRFVLIGEAVRRDEVALERELITLNNRLSVLLRENGRKSKALHEANAKLSQALKDLQDSHWHLKKIQEVLPICMGCGKVQTGESQWEEVVEYLRKNSLFLSHAYCPVCLARETGAVDGGNEGDSHGKG